MGYLGKLNLERSSSCPDHVLSQPPSGSRLEDCLVRPIPLPLGRSSLNDRKWVVIEAVKKEADYTTLMTENGSVLTMSPGMALLLASGKGQEGAVIELLQKNRISRKDLATSIIAAEENGHSKVAKRLRKGDDSPFDDVNWAIGFVRQLRARELSIVSAAERGDIVSLEEQLKEGTLSKRVRGVAVMAAAKNGHVEAVRSLLQGGSISSQDIYWVVEFGKEETKDEILSLFA